ncbi:class I SAM-dependent methyltransferase [Paenibacillus sp. VCA1]|uniref:class I SAM-dependent methyltransferase n=1 Tax=Paenibacillus sp. VCA1 TaxID=3039148 RepID=UPI002871A21F|nr:class I SAM-dependent methyltransferase [Paenibacillus sp. VCA1]MDR9854227.1 class I SAM-dependent methyltransferase [Paenibacillus sp. VCA1]
MQEIRNYYEGSHDKDAIRSIYGTEQNLKAKYEVLETYGLRKETFEEWLIGKLKLTGSELVLDVGAGNGRFSLPVGRMLKGSGGFLAACDLAEGVMIPSRVQAEKESLPILHMQADAENLPFLSEQFDLVMANHMLYHLPNLNRGLAEMGRVLKQSGRLLATTNSEKGMPELFGLHLNTMDRLGIPFGVKEELIAFSLENGEQTLSKHFKQVESWTYEAGFMVKEPEPVFQYYAATQLYQGPMNDDNLSKEVRDAIAPCFIQLTEELIREKGGELVISKPVGAFVGKI